jgi:hypothetical protein
MQTTGPTHLILLDLINLIMFDMCYKSCSSLLCCESKQDLFFACRTTPSITGYQKESHAARL